MAHDVFISCSSGDKQIADAACAVLESKGIRCWIAPRDIVPGTDWGAAIVRAIAEARVFVLVFSASANASAQIKREVERAVNRGIPVIPVRVEDAKPSDALEYYISTPHWLDAFPPPLEKHMNYLAEVVSGILKGDSPPPSQARQPMRPALLSARGPRKLAWSAAGLGLLVVLALGGWAGWQFLQASGPAIDQACLVKVEAPSAQVCANLLAQNAQWQDCSATFASQRMSRVVDRGRALLRKDHAASIVYYDPRFYGKAYGTLSHYWEMLGECVNENYLLIDQVASGVSFPEVFWSRTRHLREMFRDNWAGQNKPLPDFMSNFHDLCVAYKGERNKAQPGAGDSLDCTL